MSYQLTFIREAGDPFVHPRSFPTAAAAKTLAAALVGMTTPGVYQSVQLQRDEQVLNVGLVENSSLHWAE